MADLPLGLLFGILAVLLFLSGFFSSSETGLMAINRYRLRHRAKQGDRKARRVAHLLYRPERVIGIILLGNNFVNILAASLVSVIAIRLYGEPAIPIAALLLTIILLIFCELAPKTVAALAPEKVAYPASIILIVLLRLFQPVVWLINLAANNLLKLLGFPIESTQRHELGADELRTVVMDAGRFLGKSHRKVLLRMLDLEGGTVEDVMVPRNEIEGIDLDQLWPVIRHQLLATQYTRILLYRDTINEISGFIHVRRVLHLMAHQPDFDLKALLKLAEEPYFIPEGSPLHRQMLNFQIKKRRVGLVVDEYGDVTGLVTLEDIIEEIIGEFTTVPNETVELPYRQQSDGRYLVDASVSIRLLNRHLGWRLPTDGPKTLSGLITEYLEAIPQPGSQLTLFDHAIEIIDIDGHRIKSAYISADQSLSNEPSEELS